MRNNLVSFRLKFEHEAVSGAFSVGGDAADAGGLLFVTFYSTESAGTLSKA
jgi:hypothetical protein